VQVKFSPMMEERSNPSRGSSTRNSPALQGVEPSWQALLGVAGSSAVAAALSGTAVAGGGCDMAADVSSLPQKVYSPSMPEVSDEALRLHMMMHNSGGEEKGKRHDVVPMYLAYQQQSMHGGQQRWADARISPTVSPLAPMSAPPGEGSGGNAPQLVLATAVEHPEDQDGSFADGAGNGEKSVMAMSPLEVQGLVSLGGELQISPSRP